MDSKVDSMMDSIRGEQAAAAWAATAPTGVPRGSCVARCDRGARFVPVCLRCFGFVSSAVFPHATRRLDDEQATRDARITNGLE